MVLNLASWETWHDDAEDNNHNKQFKLGSIIFCGSATNVMIVCVLRIIILIVVAGVGFLMEAFECAEGASSVGRAAGEGWVVTVVSCTHSVYC